MTKGTQIKKLVNGEIADADDMNQIVEDAGAEGGLLPFEPDGHELDTVGSQSLGSTAYPWGSLKINQDAELVEVDKDSHTAASSIAIKNLRKFIYLKDAPSSYSGKSGYFPAVKSTENGLEFVSPPNKSAMIFCWNGFDGSVADAANLIANATDLLSTPSGLKNCYFSVLGNTNRVILRSKFLKVSGINTISINARVWSGDPTNDEKEAILTVDVGGQSNTVKSISGSGPEWVTQSTIDVSSLTNGTLYGITISLKNEASLGVGAFCSAVVLNGY